MTVDPDLADMMSAVFAAHRERHEPGEGLDALWSQLTELGLVRLTGSEESGGSGAGWSEAAELLYAAAFHGVGAPVAEHDLLACWLLDTAGLPVDAARRTACLLDATGTARGVPWASTAERVVVIWRNGATHQVADVETRTLSIAPGHNGADEPRDIVTADIAALTGTMVSDTVVAQWQLRAALIRAIQVCAALDRILELSVAHAGERIQFGRPLAKFQAVQHLVADIAAEAALARAATAGHWPRRCAPTGRRKASNFLSPWHVRVSATPPRWACATPIRFTVRSAPRGNIACTNSRSPRWPGVLSTARYNSGTTSSPISPLRRVSTGCGR